MKNIPNIIPFDKENMFGDRLILLNKSITKELENIPQDLKDWIKENKAPIVNWELEIDHTDLKLDDLLAKVIPKEISPVFPIMTIRQNKIIQLNEA